MKSTHRQVRGACLKAILTLGLTAGTGWSADPVDYQKQIQPLLKERCYACHGAKKQEASLRLDRRQEALAGGASGPAIIPGDATRGLLLERVTSDDAESVMPPKGDRLSRDEIDLLKGWIKTGADWPDDSP